MASPRESLETHLLRRLEDVLRELRIDGTSNLHAGKRLADVLDSMSMVEWIAMLAEDCGVDVRAIEDCVKRQFGTISDLAESMLQAGLRPEQAHSPDHAWPDAALPLTRHLSTEQGTACLLVATAARLPTSVQPAAKIDQALQRPPGWFESHSGIAQRHLWREQDPLEAAMEAGQECLIKARLAPASVTTLLVTSEAPPLQLGLAAALHHRLGISSHVLALEVGGACTGFLAAIELARGIVLQSGPVLIIAIEAPSLYLHLEPGPTGENAALFGDAAAAALLAPSACGDGAFAVEEVLFGVDGSQGDLLEIERAASGGVRLHMRGQPLATRAVRALVSCVEGLTRRHHKAVDDWSAIVTHGGNGLMPLMLARRLKVPTERIWSETAQTGNLGSASLPVAWALHPERPKGLVLWTAIGAGLMWGGAVLRPVV